MRKREEGRSEREETIGKGRGGDKGREIGKREAGQMVGDRKKKEDREEERERERRKRIVWV